MEKRALKSVNKYFSLCLMGLFLFSLGYIFATAINNYRLTQYAIKYDKTGIYQNNASVLNSNLVNEVLNQLKQNYINTKLDYNNLSYGMVEGMVEALEDKYTIFLNPEENEQYKNNRSPQLEGVGVILSFDGEYTEIESVLEGYPAYVGGIKADDIVLEVNGETMKAQKPSYVSSKIKGEKGTEVNIKIYRNSITQTLDFKLKREEIQIENIDYKEEETNIYRINVERFIDDSVEQFNSKWDKIVNNVCSDESNKLIIDLRYNPGGYVNSALYMLEDFLPKGVVLMKEIDRDGNEMVKYSTREPRCANNRVVIMLNDSSASASEIFAGALKDHNRALLIGEETVGKGLEQKVIELSDGSALHMVFQKWTTPSGFNPTPENPIKPDKLLELNTEEEQTNKSIEDWYTKTAITYLKN